MPLRTPLLALLTLVLFGLGSVAAPVVHRIAHASDRGHAAEAAHDFADAHAHGEGVGATGALPAWMDLDEACALCQIQLSSTEASSASTMTLPDRRAVSAPAPVQVARARHASQPTRGPPALS